MYATRAYFFKSVLRPVVGNPDNLSGACIRCYPTNLNSLSKLHRIIHRIVSYPVGASCRKPNYPINKKCHPIVLTAATDSYIGTIYGFRCMVKKE